MWPVSFKLFGGIYLTRHDRIEKYLKNLEDNIILDSQQDRIIVDDINELIKIRIRELKSLNLFVGVMYFLVYFGFISFLFTDLFIFNEFFNALSKVIGFLGTTFFIVLIFLVNKLKELYYGDLNLLTAHLISVYNKVGFKANEDVFSPRNDYDIFLKFFKRRFK